MKGKHGDEEGVLIFPNPADQKSHVEAFTYLTITGRNRVRSVTGFYSV